MKSTLAKLFLVAFAFTLVFTSCFKDDLLKEIDALKDTVSSMQRRNDSLSFFINAKADSLGKALTAAQKRSDSLASVLKTKSDSLSIALGITNSNLNALTKSVDSIKVQVANINGQLTQLNSQLKIVTIQLTQLNQQFGALGADYASLNAKYQELSATLQGLNTQIAALQAEQFKLLERLNAIILQLNPPVDITTGLVAYFPFSGNAGDSSGNGNHGTVNGATLTTDRFGTLNSSYSFNGNEFISGSSSKFPSGNSARSISIWYLANNLGFSTPGICGIQLFGYGGNVCGQSFIMNFENCDIGKGKYEVQGHCLAFRSFSNYPVPANNAWHNLTITYDGTNFRFYGDGVLSSSSANTSLSTFVTSKIFTIGRETTPDGNSPYVDPVWPAFSGKIDDVRIYNRALTQEQITYLATH